MDDSEYQERLAAWRVELDASLRARDGWLALAGLEWLTEGEFSFGSAPGNDIILPAGAPLTVGRLIVTPDQVYLQPLDGPPAEGELNDQARSQLRPDTSGNPTTLTFGPVTVVLIERGEHRALRIWDNSRAARDHFPGRRWYPADPLYQVPAKITRPPEPRFIIVPNETGVPTEEPVAGDVRFTIGGHNGQLIALPRAGDRFHLIFNDATNGKTTYGAGRYLIAGPADGDQLELDFNRAYNPPCAFTEYATCSLPPSQNRLSFPIHAGELAPRQNPDPAL